jgi:hypothetical protein
MANPDPKALAALCKQWNFTDTHTAGVCRFMKSPTGVEVMIKKDMQRARDSDIAACAAAVNLSVDAFLAGPTSDIKKKGLASDPRRRVVGFLARQEGMKVEDEKGHVMALVIDGVKGSATGIPALINAMARDGQLRLDRRGKRTYGIELVRSGPRIADLMPLEMVTPVNAHLPATEESESTELADDVVVEPRVIDLSPYSPDDIAAALMDRVILTIREGSQSTHAKVLKEVEQRLADAVGYGEKQNKLRREAEEKLLAARDKVRQLEREIKAAQRERRQVPGEVMDVLVNGTPRPARRA